MSFLSKNKFLFYDPNNIKMKRSIRYKILLVIIPLSLISFSFLGLTTYFSANDGITSIAKDFIGYRLKEIFQFSQEQLLQQRLLKNNSNMNIDYYHNVLNYAKKFEDESFLIIPYSNKFFSENSIDWSSTNNFSFLDIKRLQKILTKQEKIARETPEDRSSWIDFISDDKIKYVGIFVPNTDIQSWFVLLVNKKIFYAPVMKIVIYTIMIVLISLLVTIILVFLFVNFLTKPLTRSIETIKAITDSMDFSKRIQIEYPDEIGILGRYFNNMIEELEKSYNQIKNYAYQTVLAKKKEERIRFIFQKYVPNDIIDHVLNKSTDTMLIGNKQIVTVLFSDIREFTTISEMLKPEELVLSLNVYFTAMVEQVLTQKGIIDKFIGDAIMAIFGAPIIRKDDADHAIISAINMIKALEIFNKEQLKKEKITFDIGIGINTGSAIVGNIGSEQKVDYTVIGDPVNLGARLEGLTKSYKIPILISEFTKDALENPHIYFFLNVDIVRVKGKAYPVKIYFPILANELSLQEEEFYKEFHFAQKNYYQGNFQNALNKLQVLKDSNIKLYLIDLYIERCEHLILNPPNNWDGVETWKTK